MNTKNSMQLKAFIKNKAIEKHISPQLVMQNYMLERLLERISLSKYKCNFIIKGGFLISAIVGLDTRATMDLDTTIKGITLTNESICNIFEEICAIELNDNITFLLVGVTSIRDGDDYPGMRVHLLANYPPISVPLTVDITTGDVITPSEIEYTYELLFDNRKISIFSYNLETLLAEKIETVLSRGIANTRMRDFYDIYILYTMHISDCNLMLLHNALKRTSHKRGSFKSIEMFPKIMTMIHSSKQLRDFWVKYRENFNYAKSITFDDICNTIQTIMVNIFSVTSKN